MTSPALQHKKQNAHEHEQGVVLVLALLLLGVVTAVGIGVSLIVISEVQGSLQVGEGIVATYAAEAKVEQALDFIRVERLRSGATLDSVVTEIKTMMSGTLGFATPPGTLNPYVDTTGTTAGQSFLLTKLEKDQSVQFDVQSDECLVDANKCVRAITFSGQRLDPSAVEPWVELTTVAYSIAATGATTVQKTLIAECNFLSPTAPPLPGCGGGPSPYNFIGSPPDTVPTDTQTVRFTALYNGVKNLEIRAYTKTSPSFSCFSTPCPSDILGHININAIGQKGQARIGVSASVPWRLPSSGLFDYAIFSQETVKQE